MLFGQFVVFKLEVAHFKLTFLEGFMNFEISNVKTFVTSFLKLFSKQTSFKFLDIYLNSNLNFSVECHKYLAHCCNIFYPLPIKLITLNTTIIISCTSTTYSPVLVLVLPYLHHHHHHHHHHYHYYYDYDYHYHYHYYYHYHYCYH